MTIFGNIVLNVNTNNVFNHIYYYDTKRLCIMKVCLVAIIFWLAALIDNGVVRGIMGIIPKLL